MGAPKYRKHILINRKGEISGNTLIVDFNPQLIPMAHLPHRESTGQQRS